MAYHLVLSILISKKEDEEPQPHIFKAKVVCDRHIQMQGIQYVFIDKISMVTCHELYAINSHLGQVQEIHDKLFEGINTLSQRFCSTTPFKRSCPLQQ